MKNLILLLTIVLIFTATSLRASGEPTTNIDDFIIASISLTIDAEAQAMYDVEIDYSEADSVLEFSVAKEVSFVQVLNAEGTLEYQLPVFSKNINIDLDDFAAGKYQVNLLMENESMINSSFIK
jgi:hypothetical protein